MEFQVLKVVIDKEREKKYYTLSGKNFDVVPYGLEGYYVTQNEDDLEGHKTVNRTSGVQLINEREKNEIKKEMKKIKLEILYNADIVEYLTKEKLEIYLTNWKLDQEEANNYKGEI
jgi:hypothetical protein